LLLLAATTMHNSYLPPKIEVAAMNKRDRSKSSYQQ